MVATINASLSSRAQRRISCRWQAAMRSFAYARDDNLLLRGLHRVLDVRDGGELDVVELAAHLIDLADVDVLHDVARVRVDRDRAARALPRHTLHGGQELF